MSAQGVQSVVHTLTGQRPISPYFYRGCSNAGIWAVDKVLIAEAP